MDKLHKLADMIGSSGDHNSREFAGILLDLFGKTPIKLVYKYWLEARPIIQKHNPNLFIPTLKNFGGKKYCQKKRDQCLMKEGMGI